MKHEDLKPFVCHIQFEDDPEDVEYDYSEEPSGDPYKEYKIIKIKCKILDGPFADKTATIEIE